MVTRKSQVRSIRTTKPPLKSDFRIARRLWWALILLLPRVIWAQATGSIVGTVTDPSGAVLPGAKVTATRIDTGVSRSTVTSGAGTYIIPNLVVGTYNVTAENPGFKSGNATGITLDVSQTRQVDFKLTLIGFNPQWR